MSTIAVVGKINKGKSSLINALLKDKNLLPTDMQVCTHKLAFVQYGNNNKAEIIYQNLSKKRVNIRELKKLQEDAKNKIKRIIVYKKNDILRNYNLVFIDTPGDDVENEEDNKVRTGGIENADGIIFVLARTNLSIVEMKLLQKVVSKKIQVIIVLNRIDEILDESDTDEEGLNEIKQLESKIRETVDQISHNIKIVSLSAVNILNDENNLDIEKKALSTINMWLAVIQYPLNDLTVDDDPVFITKLLKKYGVIKLITQNGKYGKWFDYNSWSESIYKDDQNFGGLSIRYYDGSAYIVCLLQNNEGGFKFRIAVLANEIIYYDKQDTIKEELKNLDLEYNILNGYIEGYKFLDFNNYSPRITALEISEKLEQIIGKELK